MSRIFLFLLLTASFLNFKAAASDEPVELYSYWQSSCSWRVRIALDLKKIDYKYISVNLAAARTDEYLGLNPSGKVPALRIDGKVFSQSLAIIEYLEETRPEPALLPGDAGEKALVRQIVQMIACDIQPLQSLSLVKVMGEAQMLAFAQTNIAKGFAAIEKVLQSTAGIYCVGDHVTIADLFLVPQVFNARKYGVDLTLYPTIVQVDKNLCMLPEFQQTNPNLQPDKS